VELAREPGTCLGTGSQPVPVPGLGIWEPVKPGPGPVSRKRIGYPVMLTLLGAISIFSSLMSLRQKEIIPKKTVLGDK